MKHVFPKFWRPVAPGGWGIVPGVALLVVARFPLVVRADLLK